MMIMYNVYTAIQKTSSHVYGITYNTTDISLTWSHLNKVV